VEQCLAPESLTARQIMSSPVLTINETASIDEAAKFMAKRKQPEPIEANLSFQQMEAAIPKIDRRIAVSKGSYFLVDGKVRHSLQTAHFDNGNNLKVSLKISK
jgi:CBS domain-containing protein